MSICSHKCVSVMSLAIISATIMDVIWYIRYKGCCCGEGEPRYNIKGEKEWKSTLSI